MMEPFAAAAREAALHSLDAAPMPDGAPPDTLSSVHASLARVMADAFSLGIKLPALVEAATSASAAFAKARENARAAVAARHNDSAGPDAPRLLPFADDLLLVFVNGLRSDR